MNIADPHFESPLWLWLVVFGPALLFWLQRRAARRRREQLARVASAHALADLTRSHSPARRAVKEWLMLVVLALGGLALARPQWGQFQSRDHWLGEDVMFILDCSRSMLATDVSPSRLQRAKYSILDFIKRHGSGRVGLVAFSGGAFLQCPLTFDYAAFEDALLAVDERTIPVGGTDVGRALQEAQHAMEKKSARKLIVLLTDGEDLEKTGVRVAEDLAKQGMTVYTVGVGTPAGAEIRVLTTEGQVDYVRDERGEIVRSKLDEPTLTAIAKASRGKYQLLGRVGEGLAQVRAAVESTAPGAPGRAQSRGVDRFHYPLALAVILMVGESLLGTRRRTPASAGNRAGALQLRPPPTPARNVGAPGFAAFVVGAFWALVLPAFAATNESTNQAVLATPPPPPPRTAREFYNLGTRHLQSGRLNEAEVALQAALGKQEEGIQPVALYNAGHVRFAQGREELKKSPTARNTVTQGVAATERAEDASRSAEEALASEEVQKMVAAYLRGRGARKELRGALSAVQRAMEAHVKTLLKWRRSLGDFQSAAELNPADTNAVHNAAVVERAIAQLVDQLRQMQQMAMSGLGAKARLEGLMDKLKGKVPKGQIPPGSDGEDGDEPEPGGLSLEEIRDLVEGPSEEGREMEMSLSPEEASGLLDGFKLGGNRRLPMGEGNQADPKDRKRRNW